MMMFVSSNKGKPAAFMQHHKPRSWWGDPQVNRVLKGGKWMTYSSATCVVMRHYPQKL
jgi:hypothetical protein